VSTPLRILAPGSKSQTQRALILAALAGGESTIVDPLECDDSQHLRRALQDLGVGIRCEPGHWQVSGGPDRLKTPGAPLDCGEGGTTLRFLAPMSLLVDGPLVLTGQGRLVRRPVAEMVQALESLGARALVPQAPRSPDPQIPRSPNLPLTLRRTNDPASSVRVEVTRSSQFLSGLLMVAPCLRQGLRLETCDGSMVSRPYVEMTLTAMEAFGVGVQQRDGAFEVFPSAYDPCEDYRVEGDWSAGAFLLAAARICGRQVEVPNLDPRSVQGDRAMAGFMEELDHDRVHRFDLTHCPDLIAPLAAACAIAAAGSHPCQITGAAHTRHKESDRVSVLARGLQRAGISVSERDDGLLIQPATEVNAATLDPRGDHRMAMAFGLLRLRQPQLRVQDPGCVSKSYPRFWDDLERFAGEGSR